MELAEAVRTAVTSRYFTPDPVTNDELRTAFDYARFAPQGGNRQPLRWVVVRDAEVKRQLRDWYLVPWKGYYEAAQAGSVGVGATNASRALANADHFAEHLHDVPVIVVACAELAGLHPTDTELDRLSIVGGGSVYPAVQNFLLGCREAGLGAALTTLLVAFESQVKELLAIPDGFATAAHIAVGRRPRDFPTTLDRRPLEEVVFDGRWDAPAYG
jgi:nitroreductase